MSTLAQLRRKKNLARVFPGAKVRISINRANEFAIMCQLPTNKKGRAAKHVPFIIYNLGIKKQLLRQQL